MLQKFENHRLFFSLAFDFGSIRDDRTCQNCVVTKVNGWLKRKYSHKIFYRREKLIRE